MKDEHDLDKNDNNQLTVHYLMHPWFFFKKHIRNVFFPNIPSSSSFHVTSQRPRFFYQVDESRLIISPIMIVITEKVECTGDLCSYQHVYCKQEQQRLIHYGESSLG